MEKKKSSKRGQKRASGGRALERENIYIYIYFSSLRFYLTSTKIGSHVFVGTEGKVDLHDESYAWTPKSWSFIKLHEVGNFPTCVISSLKAI